MAKKRKSGQKTEIIISDRYKLVREPLNWVVHEYREIESSDGTITEAWTNAGRYFAYIEHAITWLAREVFNNNGRQYELQDAVKAIDKSNRKLAREIAEALENSEIG